LNYQSTSTVTKHFKDIAMHKQKIEGNLPSAESRRKAKNRKRGKPSEHTKRFRTLYAYSPEAGMKVPVGQSAPYAMRSMASVGGKTRRAMEKRKRVPVGGMPAVAMLPQWMQGGIAAFAKFAQQVLMRDAHLSARQRREKAAA
jgi:hypothetical protein